MTALIETSIQCLSAIVHGNFRPFSPAKLCQVFHNFKSLLQSHEMALHRVASEGHVDMVKYLAENGAEVNAKSWESV